MTCASAEAKARGSSGRDAFAERFGDVAEAPIGVRLLVEGHGGINAAIVEPMHQRVAGIDVHRMRCHLGS
jgi:hypothetical protein